MVTRMSLWPCPAVKGFSQHILKGRCNEDELRSHAQLQRMPSTLPLHVTTQYSCLHFFHFSLLFIRFYVLLFESSALVYFFFFCIFVHIFVDLCFSLLCTKHIHEYFSINPLLLIFAGAASSEPFLSFLLYSLDLRPVLLKKMSLNRQTIGEI